MTHIFAWNKKRIQKEYFMYFLGLIFCCIITLEFILYGTFIGIRPNGLIAQYVVGAFIGVFLLVEWLFHYALYLYPSRKEFLMFNNTGISVFSLNEKINWKDIVSILPSPDIGHIKLRLNKPISKRGLIASNMPKTEQITIDPSVLSLESISATELLHMMRNMWEQNKE